MAVALQGEAVDARLVAEPAGCRQQAQGLLRPPEAGRDPGQGLQGVRDAGVVAVAGQDLDAVVRQLPGQVEAACGLLELRQADERPAERVGVAGITGEVTGAVQALPRVVAAALPQRERAR